MLTPNATATPDADILLADLDQAWQKGDWPVAVTVLDALQAVDPSAADFTDKRYVAQYSWGKDLLVQGDKSGAASHFVLAEQIDAARGEANAELLALTPTPTPIPPTPIPVPTPTPAPLALFPTVQTLLTGMNNDTPSQPKLREFQYYSDSGLVDLDFNMQQNLTAGMTRDGLKIQMSDLYMAIFRDNGPAVKSASLRAWGPVTDKYGNNRYAMLIGTTLQGSDARRINWSTDHATLELQLIPGLWTTFLGNTSLGWPQSH